MQKNRLGRHTDQQNSIYSMRMYQNLPFFMKKRPKMAVFWSKIECFSLRQAVQDPHPPYVEGSGCEKAVAEAHRPQKLHLQHP